MVGSIKGGVGRVLSCRKGEGLNLSNTRAIWRVDFPNLRILPGDSSMLGQRSLEIGQSLTVGQQLLRRGNSISCIGDHLGNVKVKKPSLI